MFLFCRVFGQLGWENSTLLKGRGVCTAWTLFKFKRGHSDWDWVISAGLLQVIPRRRKTSLYSCVSNSHYRPRPCLLLFGFIISTNQEILFITVFHNRFLFSQLWHSADELLLVSFAACGRVVANQNKGFRLWNHNKLSITVHYFAMTR